MKTIKSTFNLWLAACFLLSFTSIIYSEKLPIQNLHLPPGFSISIYAENIAKVRDLTLGLNNIVFVGTSGDKVSDPPSKALTLTNH